MDEAVFTETWAALRAALAADAAVTALVPADRILDHVPEAVAFPYIRLGTLEPRPDDTDGTQGAIAQVGLEVHSRPEYGRTEAAQICGRIAKALHRKPEALTVAGYDVTDTQVQTWVVDRAPDGVTWQGTVALEVMLQAV